MVLLALRLHGDHLGEEKETLVDVLALLLPLARSACSAAHHQHAALTPRVRPVSRAVRARVANGRPDRHARLARGVMDVCSLGTCQVDKVQDG